MENQIQPAFDKVMIIDVIKQTFIPGGNINEDDIRLM